MPCTVKEVFTAFASQIQSLLTALAACLSAIHCFLLPGKMIKAPIRAQTLQLIKHIAEIARQQENASTCVACDRTCKLCQLFPLAHYNSLDCIKL